MMTPMIRRVACVASRAMARQAAPAATAMAQRGVCAAPVSRFVTIQNVRFNSSLGGLLDREIQEEKGNCFEGEELESLQAEVTKVFKISETPGKMEVVLRGQVQGSDVRVTFDAQDSVELDETYGDEELEDAEGAAEEDDEEAEDELPGIRFVAEISRNGQGLQFDCVASSNVTVERVRYLHDLSKDAQDDDLYYGPSFIDLEFDLQSEFYNYLAEHHVDDTLAQFIAQYADLKEQREYFTFLQDAAKFVKN